MKRTTASRALALIIVALVAADWASKIWVTNQLALGETWALVDGWLYFIHRQNPGVAFSLLADFPGIWRVPVLSMLSLLGVVLFARIVRATPDPIARLAGSAVIAGAIGNMGDRLLSGEVTDFVFVAFFPFVFNLADAAITVGGSVLAVRLAFGGAATPAPAAVGADAETA